MKRAPVFDCVIDARARLGEGAIWSAHQQRLLWVDIPTGQVNRYDPVSHHNESWEFGRPMTRFALLSLPELLASSLCMDLVPRST